MRYHSFRHTALLCGALILAACANRGTGPQGGPKDETPPVVTKTTPANGALNWTKKRIEIDFDENIQVENPGEKVVISPAQRKNPLIQAVGKKLQVTFVDSLHSNTTYTIDFADAIKDLNEGNIFPDYAFTFATGEHIDSLRVSGNIIDAQTLNPVKNCYVGLYAADTSWTDSTVYRKPMIRVGKTNDKGRFLISGVAEGTYHILALSDESRDLMYQSGEGIATCSTTITPYSEPGIRQDTIWKDSVTVDSIQTTAITRFLPNDLVMRLYKEPRSRQFLSRVERKTPQAFTLYFNAPVRVMPELIGTDSTAWTQHLLRQVNTTRDTLTYWITDSTIYRKDSLYFICRYEKTDSLGELQPQEDTLKAFYRKTSFNAKAKKQSPKKEFLDIKTTAKSPFEIYSSLIISSPTPVENIRQEGIHLFTREDKDTTQVAFDIVGLDSIGMRYEIVCKLESNRDYELVIDSAALCDIYGQSSKQSKQKLKVRSTEEYATLLVRVSPQESPLVIQLLNNKDEVLRSQDAEPNGTTFTHLLAGEYYLRCFADDNADGVWTTGNYLEHREPEQVWYYPTKLTLRANWDFEEVWDLNIIPPLQQKPEELITKGKK